MNTKILLLTLFVLTIACLEVSARHHGHRHHGRKHGSYEKHDYDNDRHGSKHHGSKHHGHRHHGKKHHDDEHRGKRDISDNEIEFGAPIQVSFDDIEGNDIIQDPYFTYSNEEQEPIDVTEMAIVEPVQQVNVLSIIRAKLEEELAFLNNMEKIASENLACFVADIWVTSFKRQLMNTLQSSYCAKSYKFEDDSNDYTF